MIPGSVWKFVVVIPVGGSADRDFREHTSDVDGNRQAGDIHVYFSGVGVEDSYTPTGLYQQYTASHCNYY